VEPQPRKAREVPIRADQGGAVLESEGGEERVHYERARDLGVHEQGLQDLPALFPGFDHEHGIAPSQDDTISIASAGESGAWNMREFVLMRIKARTVTQARPTGSSPEKAPSTKRRQES
jgi:hypothetical protein